MTVSTLAAVAPPVAPAPLLAGSLSGFALADVLQLLELGARSGVLVVNGGPLGGGSVRLRAGCVVAAACDGRTATAGFDRASAVAELLELAAGHWAFHASDGTDASGDVGSAVDGLRISAILVDAARRRDEWERVAVGTDEGDDVPRLASDADDDSAADCLTAADLHVLTGVDGVRDVRAIAAAVRRDEARVRAAIATLRRLGVLCPRAVDARGTAVA